MVNIFIARLLVMEDYGVIAMPGISIVMPLPFIDSAFAINIVESILTR